MDGLMMMMMMMDHGGLMAMVRGEAWHGMPHNMVTSRVKAMSIWQGTFLNGIAWRTDVRKERPAQERKWIERKEDVRAGIQ